MTIFSPGPRVVMLTLVLLAALAGASACGSAQAGPTAIAPDHPRQGDLHWLDEAHQANVAEAQVGQLAETYAGTAQLRSDGKILFRDHTALDAKLVKVAERLKVHLVQELTPGEGSVRDQLLKETGQKFDNDFVADMLTAHEELIAATKSEIAHGSSAPIKALARQTLPVLEKHLRMMRAAAGSG